MSDIITALEKKADLHALIGHRGRFHAVVYAKPEQKAAAFGEVLAAEGRAGKDGYLAVRDDIRAALRTAQDLQRARRAAEKALVAKGEGPSQERSIIYWHRILDRSGITRLLAVRKAGKDWSRAARAAEVEAAKENA